MTHDFSDLTPPLELMLEWDASEYGYKHAIRWGAEQAAEQLAGQWPTPITDRPPTDADADDKCHVQVLNHCGTWGWSGWRDAAGRPWLHTPRWQRPAPLTLKEQALKNVDFIADNATGGDLVSRLNQIRRALETDS